MDNQPHIQFNTEGEGLVCDNPNCDWEDKTIKWSEAHNWINKDCPKCGENILTQEDYDTTNELLEGIRIINSMSIEEIEALGIHLGLSEEEVSSRKVSHVTVKVHNGFIYKIKMVVN